MVVRHTELKKMEQLYEENGNQLVLLYGREGCDKEAFIKLFCKEKSIFIIVPERHPHRSSACSWDMRLRSSMN